MTWRYNEVIREYERSCRKCGGKGKETWHPKYAHYCLDKYDVIEHPSNTQKKDTNYVGIGHQLILCEVCRLVWVRYYETGPDSCDIPVPECLGKEIPSENWKPGEKVH